MGFPMLVRWYLYIESGPWAHGIDLSLQEYSSLGNRRVTAVHISNHIIGFSKLFIEDTHSFPMNTFMGLYFGPIRPMMHIFIIHFYFPKNFVALDILYLQFHTMSITLSVMIIYSIVSIFAGECLSLAFQRYASAYILVSILFSCSPGPL